MRRVLPLALTAVFLLALTGLPTSQAAPQSDLNGCTSNTPFSGTLTTPPFSTPSVAPTVAFETWWETESVNTQGVDLKVVEASTDGANWTVVSTLNEDLPVGETGSAEKPWSNIGLQLKPDWETHSFTLPPQFLSQQAVQLRFRFDTGDTLFNGFRGWGIDNVRVLESVNFFFGPEGFDEGAIPSNWGRTGFWTVPSAPEDTQIHPGIAPPLVTLGLDGSLPDAGLLPANQINSTGYAWFGQESTATYCGENFDVTMTLDPFTAQRTAGETHTVNVSLANVNETAGRTLRFNVTGANPTSGSVPLPVGTSTVPVSWTGSNPGFDVLEVHLDADGDGVVGPDEIVRTAEINWSPQATLALTPTSAARTVGETHAVSATATGAVPGSLIQFSVAGPNAVVGTADVNPATGQGTIRWIGANPGHDVVTAVLDIDGDGLPDPGEPGATAAADWAARDQRQPQQQALTLDDLPDPEPFREVNVQRIGPGPVFVRLPGNAARTSQAGAPRGFVPLEAAAQVPVGSILETSRGRVALESTADARGLRTQRAQFYAGMFQVLQPRAQRPVTEMVLKGGSFRGCGSARPAASWSRAEASQRRRQGRRVRRVLGDGRGRFRTRGRYSSATVRGTTWLVEDRCNGTLTRVAARPRTNRVEVRNLVTRRTRVLRAGQSLFVPRPLGRR